MSDTTEWVTYVIIARDIRSTKRCRKVFRVEKIGTAKERLKVVLDGAKSELYGDRQFPVNLWKIDRVWQILNGGKR